MSTVRGAGDPESVSSAAEAAKLRRDREVAALALGEDAPLVGGVDMVAAFAGAVVCCAGAL